MSSRHLRRLADKYSLESELERISNLNTNTGSEKLELKQQVNSFFSLVQDNDIEIEDSSSEDNSRVKEPLRVEHNVKSCSHRKKKKKKVQKSSRDNSDYQLDQDFDNVIKKFQLESGLGKSVVSDLEYETASEGKIITYDLDTSVTDNVAGNIEVFKCLKHFFDIDFKKLNPDNEFRALFDDLSYKSLNDADSIASTHVSLEVLEHINKLKRVTKNWGGKNRKIVPNEGLIHHLQFTKIRDDWLPTKRGELFMKPLTKQNLISWQRWQRPLDWDDVIKNDVDLLLERADFYKFEPINLDLSKKALTEFYLCTVLYPDHESLISLINSKFPYHVPAILQVSLILIRQGDKSNSNGLVERALFVFDRALRSGVVFNGNKCQLPYIYFYNRQFYLSIFRYLSIVFQRGAICTATEWCKVLWSLSPVEDPLGCRYFIDHYLLSNGDYQFLIDLTKSPLVTTYSEWFTLGLSLGVVLSYLRLKNVDLARESLLKAFKYHPHALSRIFGSALLEGSFKNMDSLTSNDIKTDIETKAYLVRMKTLWKDSDIEFLRSELALILQDYQSGKINLVLEKSIPDRTDNPFYIEGIPINLLRFSILSQEPSVMAAIPNFIWSNHDVYEFDVLPPLPHDRNSQEVIETIRSFISEEELSLQQSELFQDEQLLDHVRQISLNQFLEESSNG